jgi:hypothetical protein
MRMGNPGDVLSHDVAELRKTRRDAINLLAPELRYAFQAESELARGRSRANRVDALLEEFTVSFAGHLPSFEYELAFLPAWQESAPMLYQTSWWINEYVAGVYFIFDAKQTLQKIGSSCGGKLGPRVYLKARESYRTSVDVVLFGRAWAHFALAFEALAVSRLRPPKNDREFKNLWIPPPTPFDEIWSRPNGCQNGIPASGLG